jgi:uncharacterized membrane protein
MRVKCHIWTYEGAQRGLLGRGILMLHILVIIVLLVLFIFRILVDSLRTLKFLLVLVSMNY